MSDTTTVAGPIDYRQRYTTQIEATEAHLDGRQAQMHTTMPGQIISYNPSLMTAVVQPCIQSLYQAIDGTIQPTTIKPISDVPVVFPGGGGYLLTFPVRAGDDCLLVFASRSIDNWFQHGGVQQPSDWRMHDINDCFAMVGVRSQPQVPGGSNISGPAPSGNTVQVRSDGGNVLIDLNGAANLITITSPTVMCTGDLHVKGAIISGFGTGDQIGLQTHRHNQPNDSHGDSEQPTNAPIAGSLTAREEVYLMSERDTSEPPPMPQITEATPLAEIVFILQTQLGRIEAMVKQIHDAVASTQEHRLGHD